VSDELNNPDAIVFVFRHKSGRVKATYPEQTFAILENEEYEHIATLEPRLWIQAHYDEVTNA
jgi:hypothetical protein